MKNKFFTAIMLLVPFLGIYKTGFSSLLLADIVLLGMLAVLLLTERTYKICKEVLWYMLLILFSYLLSVMQYPSAVMADISMQMLRYLFYLSILCMFSRKFFDVNLGEKIYGEISVFVTIFLFVQTAVYKIFHYYIPGYLPFLPVAREELVWHATNQYQRFQYDPRARSLFSEPQQYASYVLGFLAILLIKNVWTKKEKIQVLFLSLGIIVSASSTGILCLIALWGVKIIREVKRKKIKKFTFIILTGALLVPFLSSFQVFMRRTSTGGAAEGRLSGYGELLSEKQNLFQTLFGHGMVDIDSNEFTLQYGFVPTYLRLYYFFGITGVFITAIILLQLLRKTQHQYKLLMLLVLILNIGTVDWFGSMILVSLPFVITKQRVTQKERESDAAGSNLYHLSV